MPGFYSIDGLMSNLDTTAIINALIEAESGPINRLRERQAETTNVATTYTALSALMLAAKSHSAGLARATAFDLYTTTVSDEDVLTVGVTPDASPGTFAINVLALAKNHQIAGQGFDTADATSLGTGTVQLSIGDGSVTTLTIDGTNNTLTGLKDAINEANIGVSATIIDDGSSNNPYRLILSSKDSGKENQINITVGLSGGTTPNFSTAVFDAVETDGLSAVSTSLVTKGATAAYTGSANKIYTFTVAGSGTQTVGAGDITINWSDGTDSGTFDISEADTEIALTGTGADGLKLSFGAGDLKAGDTFAVQAFAPTLQAAADAQVSMGSTVGGGSPIVVTSATNKVQDLIAGVTLNLQQVSEQPVTIEVAIDQSTIQTNITGMLDKYNKVMNYIDNQFSYNEDTGEAGTLIGDGYLLAMQSSLRASLSGALGGLPSGMNMLTAVGIRTGGGGQLRLADRSMLNEAIADDLEAVKNLFTKSGTSTSKLVNFLSATGATKTTADGYAVEITQAATKGYLQGGLIYNPASQSLIIDSTNKNLKITVDGVTSEAITLTEKTYTSSEELIKELNNKITADDKIGKYGLAAEWVATTATTGYLKLVSPSYGSSSQVTVDLGQANSAYTSLGLGSANAVTGKDVAGTINGESATGTGRVLLGDDDNENTAGLKLTISLTEADLGVGAEATVTYAEGFAARLDRALDSMTRTLDGTIARRTKGLEDQISYYDDLITDYEKRLDRRRESLYEQFWNLEKVLGNLQSQGDYFNSQLQQVKSLFG